MADLFRIGSRGSPLALTQANLVRTALETQFPDLRCEIVVIKTTGDKDRVRSLVAMGGQGVFVKELENALLDGSVDVAVHSLKDVPSAMAAGLDLAGYLRREDPRDVLVMRQGASWRDLPAGALVGTGSPRRVLQLKALRPDVRCTDLRGNLDSRIQRVVSGELDAILLGYAGLNRLGWSDRVSYAFAPEEMVPAVAQGIVGLQVNTARAEVVARITAISDGAAARAAQVERGVMAALGGGCRVPMAALFEPRAAAGVLHVYLGNPATGLGKYWRRDFSAGAVDWENWIVQVMDECRAAGIPLPGEVSEHALMEFWGQPEKLP